MTLIDLIERQTPPNGENLSQIKKGKRRIAQDDSIDVSLHYALQKMKSPLKKARVEENSPVLSPPSAAISPTQSGRALKILPTSSVNSPSPSSAISPGPSFHAPARGDLVEFIVPDWYRNASRPNRLTTKQQEANVVLKRIRAASNEIKANQATESTAKELGEAIQQAVFTKVDKELLKYANMLDRNIGLPFIATKSRLPAYVRSDAKILFHQWREETFEYEPWGGMKRKKPDSGEGLGPWRIDKHFKGACTYEKKEWKIFGNNNLENGQWWPLLDAALRDGAHGATQAGISGVNGKGATSILVAMNPDYEEDRDEGDIIKYTGTMKLKDGSEDPSRHTQLLIDSWMNRGRTQYPVRVIRSYNAAKRSEFAPSEGYRYDGLYKVTDYKEIDPQKRHFLFTIERQENQEPIRYQGDSARPNSQEVKFMAKEKALSGRSGL